MAKEQNAPKKEETSLYTTLIHNTLIPIFLMVSTPIGLIVFWMICERYNGSVLAFLNAISKEGNLVGEIQAIINQWPMPNWDAAKVIATFAAIQAFFQVALPGSIHYGPITPRGHIPKYKLNGVLAHVLTYVIIYVVFVQLKLVSVSYVFDNFGSILQTLSAFSFGVCFLLSFKGLYFPSTPDSGSNGNPIMDFYWGTELHPSIFGFNLKQFANCRFGMMSWCALLCIYALKQQELYGYISNSMLVSVGLQAVYCMKFFYWEGGYFGTLDIMHDRFGYYIYWGVTCWVPGIYTLTGFYLTRHPVQWDNISAVAIFLLGCYSIYANWEADEQRQRIRADPNYKIWGKTGKTVTARYTVEKVDPKTGKVTYEDKTSKLLVSGWWGIARHFHYIPELAAAFLWSSPAGFDNLFIPYFYPVYLTILLVHRLIRDEERCRKKYGEDWNTYCKEVPYRFIPYVF